MPYPTPGSPRKSRENLFVMNDAIDLQAGGPPRSDPVARRHKMASQHRQAKTIVSSFSTLFMLLASFFAGALYSRRIPPGDAVGEEPSLGVPKVALAKTLQTFRPDPAFTAEPVPGSKEPAWDALIPNGLGYVNRTELSPSFSVVAAFHQLHCLYTLRRAYYATGDGGLEDFDFGRQRGPHVAHCFEYLRQSIQCSADSSIEPAHHHHAQGFLGWDVPRQCYDYEQLKRWAEQRRAFDAHGFLADELRRSGGATR